MGKIHRKSVQTGFRIFADQLEGLHHVRRRKYRDGVSAAHLIREAIDRYLDQELGRQQSEAKAKRATGG